MSSPAPASSSTLPVGDSSKRRRVWANVGIAVATFLSAALAAGYADTRLYGHRAGETIGDLTAAAFFASLAVCAGLCWRFRSTAALLVTAVIACLPPLFLPADSLPALIAMASVIVWHPDVRARVGVAAGATLATFVAVWRDSRGTRDDTSFWNSLEHPDGSPGTWEPMPLWQVALITALLVAAFAGVALLRRSRRDVTREHARAAQAQRQAHQARTHAAEAQSRAQDLGRRLAEQDEREALAREVHDVLGHRLSILAMQANALEIEAQASGALDVQERARQIQQGAAGSMTDLRSLLAILRHGPQAGERPYELADIATLVTECIDAGTPVSSNVFVDQSSPLDPVVSRSAYRITTELLTNARKHSPGNLVRLHIHGNPHDGLVISTENPLGSGGSGTGSQSGLAGIGRRANDLGGRFWAGPSLDGRTYTATAKLPWHLPR
ncbi:hypothetical protein H7F30_04455 [Dermacoccus sp. PAMC28757]|uniref:sensor histidine kinase n=1 Tax=Dermacoccus sp. PAMC28757 TaxID=2762331 RepID=UPI00164DC63C|nr:histidine kinase [Dermacoccus sp. PAMC28757]QNK53556.1 hypothetical protein H7F30_04455 [Dermacoccus sp. PAMC28757]